jgi:hypothetical protein
MFLRQFNCVSVGGLKNFDIIKMQQHGMYVKKNNNILFTTRNIFTPDGGLSDQNNTQHSVNEILFNGAFVSVLTELSFE